MEPLTELAEIAEMLCDPHRHTEVLYDADDRRNRRPRRVYTTTQDGLLKQLRDAAHEGLRVGPPGTAGKPDSRPPGSFEALARHVYISVTVGQWCAALGVPVRDTVEGSVHALVGRAGALDDDARRRLLHEARYWRGQAQAATGWTSPPYAPPVPCPCCSRVGTLRVNLASRGAYCASPERTETGELICGATWAPGTVTEGSALVKYIRAVTEAA